MKIKKPRVDSFEKGERLIKLFDKSMKKQVLTKKELEVKGIRLRSELREVDAQMYLANKKLNALHKVHGEVEKMLPSLKSKANLQNFDR